MRQQPVEGFFFAAQKIPGIDGQAQGGLDDAGTLIRTVADYTAADLFTQSDVECPKLLRNLLSIASLLFWIKV